MNVDGAYKKNVAVHIVVRNSKNELGAVTIENVIGCFDAEHVETLAFLKVLEFGRDFGIFHFVLEGNTLSVVMNINNKQKDLSMIRRIILGIQEMLLQFPVVLMNHVCMRNNQPTHEAANIAFSSSRNSLWFKNFLKVVMDAVNRGENQSVIRLLEIGHFDIFTCKFSDQFRIQFHPKLIQY